MPINTDEFRPTFSKEDYNPRIFTHTGRTTGSDYDIDTWCKRQTTARTPGPAPANSYGWICPRCKSVWAPHVTKCDCG